MPSTKAARQSKITATVRNGRPQIKPATKAAQKTVAKKPYKQEAARVEVVEQHKSRNAQGVEIQILASNSKTPLTIEQLAEKTGYSVARVKDHVDYEVSKGRSKMNGKKQVVVLSQPVRRNAG